MSGKTLEELNFRRELARQFIKVVDAITEAELSELGFTQEQKASALEEYKRQLAQIDAQITEVTGTPPPVTIGLKTARLFGKSKLS